MHLTPRLSSRCLARFALTLLATALAACGARSESASDTKFGLLDAGVSSLPYSFYLAEPGETIGVCDAGASAPMLDFVVQSVQIWVKPLRRGPYLPVVKSCATKWRLDVRQVSFPDGRTYGRMTQPYNGSTTEKLLEYASYAGLPTAVHEVGHAFGFCDLYGAGGDGVFNADCGTRAGRSDDSAMNGAGHGGTISQDDVQGIYALIARPEFAAVSQRWSTYIAAQGGSSAAPTPPVSPTTPTPVSPTPPTTPVAPTTPGPAPVQVCAPYEITVACKCASGGSMCMAMQVATSPDAACSARCNALLNPR